MKIYDVIKHTADIGIKVYAKSLNELFINAAIGMFDTIIGVGNIASEKQKHIEISSEDKNELLVEWLRELLFRFNTEKMLFSRFDIEKLNPTSLSAKIYGEVFSAEKHNINTEIKAVTYHGLDIKEKDGFLSVQIIFDT